jgi:hypothetical protein
MTDSAQSSIARSKQRIKYWLDVCTQREVGVPDDGCADASLAIRAAFTHRCNPVGKLHLSDGPQAGRPTLSPHGASFYKHSCTNVVTTIDVSLDVG